MQTLFKLAFEPRAQSVGQDFVAVEVGIEYRVVVDAQSLYHLQALQVFLPNKFAFFVVFFDKALEFLLFCLAFVYYGRCFRHSARDLFGRVAYKHVIKIARRFAVDKMPVILHPAHYSVLAHNAILDVIEVVGAVGYLRFYALLYCVYIVGVNHADKGIARKRFELGEVFAFEDAD